MSFKFFLCVFLKYLFCFLFVLFGRLISRWTRKHTGRNSSTGRLQFSPPSPSRFQMIPPPLHNPPNKAKKTRGKKAEGQISLCNKSIDALTPVAW